MNDQPSPLTAEQLDQINTRANAATKGPWGFYDGDNYADVAADLQMTGRASYSYRQKIAQFEDENYWDDPAHENDDEERAPKQMAANAEFVAHAREDVPALLAEVGRLRADLAEARPATGNPSVITDRVLSQVLAERIRQDTKWGEQNHPDNTGSTFYLKRAVAARRNCQLAADAGMTAWDLVLLEEVLEALAEADPVKLRAELVQVAAVAVAWIEAIDRRAAAADETGPEKYPTLIGVYCDTCGTEVRGDYIVSDAMDTAARLEVARDYLRRNLGWSCTAAGDFCPKHVSHAAAEQPTACAKCTQPFDPADTRFDGRARHRATPYCRGCVDRCHDNESADHRCVICA